MTLTEFLEARIAEDEAVARSGEPTWPDDPDFRVVPVEEGSEGEIIVSPARLLAECEAKRRRVADFEELNRDYKVARTDSLWARRFQATIAMAHDAAVYADHPDYREEWKP